MHDGLSLNVGILGNISSVVPRKSRESLIHLQHINVWAPAGRASCLDRKTHGNVTVCQDYPSCVDRTMFMCSSQLGTKTVVSFALATVTLGQHDRTRFVGFKQSRKWDVGWRACH